MRLELFDPEADEARREACRLIREAARRAEDPSGMPMVPARFRYTFSTRHASDLLEMWLATGDDGGPAGYCTVGLPGQQNLSLANCSVWVAPGLRRQGTGTALLAHCAGRGRAAGRTVLHAQAKDGSAGEAFARRAGAAAGMAEVRRAMPVGDGTAALLEQLRERAAAPDYDLVSWTGHTPGFDLDQMTGLWNTMSDAPHNAGVAATRWDAALVRRVEGQLMAGGAQLYQVAARHRASGELAAMTQVAVDPAVPEAGIQGNTVVARPHRGRRLGMLVKATLYEWLTGTLPGLREFRTWNADSNEHMVAINDQLGFRAVARFRTWTLPLTLPPAAASR